MVATTAPLLGVLATAFGIVGSFPGYGCDKGTLFAIVTGLLSESLWPTMLGIAIAVFAECLHRCLLSKLEVFDSEMQAAAYQLSAGAVGRSGDVAEMYAGFAAIDVRRPALRWRGRRYNCGSR